LYTAKKITKPLVSDITWFAGTRLYGRDKTQLHL
jgi:hypothetical protein